MSNKDRISIKSASNPEDMSAEHFVATVIAELDTTIKSNNSPNNKESDDPNNSTSANHQRSTTNGILIEFQNTISVACYQSVSNNTMKQN